MTTSLLPEPYRLALQALKDQAAAATAQLTDRGAAKAELADAQRRMAQHDAETKHIVRVVLKAKPLVSIPELSEDRLAALLGFNKLD
ncbi:MULTISPECIES: hypothetical protein [Cupriavidus]